MYLIVFSFASSLEVFADVARAETSRGPKLALDGEIRSVSKGPNLIDPLAVPWQLGVADQFGFSEKCCSLPLLGHVFF